MERSAEVAWFVNYALDTSDSLRGATLQQPCRLAYADGDAVSSRQGSQPSSSCAAFSRVASRSHGSRLHRARTCVGSYWLRGGRQAASLHRAPLGANRQSKRLRTRSSSFSEGSMWA